jgi:shikimate kinase
MSTSTINSPSAKSSASDIASISGGFSFIGPRFSGKTKMAEMVAARLGFPLFDTDKIFNQQYNMTVAQFLRSSGGNWEPFRKAETGIVLDLYPALPKNAIVSLGGGVAAHEFDYYRELNIETMRVAGPVIYLRPDPLMPICIQILSDREAKTLNDPNRPDLHNSVALSLHDKTRLTLEKRDPHYRRASDTIIYELDSKSPMPEQVALEQRAEHIIRIMATLRK